MEENTLSVLKIAPGQYPQQVEIDNDLKALQQAVGGSIGASYPFEDPVAIVYNDDGKLMGLPLNRALRDENGEMYDAVAGDFPLGRRTRRHPASDRGCAEPQQADENTGQCGFAAAGVPDSQIHCGH